VVDVEDSEDGGKMVEAVHRIPAWSWPTLQEMAKILGIQDVRKSGVVEVGADQVGPGEMAVAYECSPASYAQLEEFWELRFVLEFDEQGRRKGKSSSRSQSFLDFCLQLSNSFHLLAVYGDEGEEVQQGHPLPSAVPDRALQLASKPALEEDFGEILREFGWSGSSLVGGGGPGSGRKKKVKQEIQPDKEVKREIKKEPGTSSSSKIEGPLQVVSSAEEDLFEGAEKEDQGSDSAGVLADLSLPPCKKRRLQDRAQWVGGD
jgi:hypothetical protein